MKFTILLLVFFTLLISSCTTAYKTGQTPDDVYYSPVRAEDEYVNTEKRDDYRYSDAYYDNRYLRMKVRNRYRWEYLDDWYVYDRYSIGYNYYFGTYNNPYNTWNYYYNPYGYCSGKGYVYNPRTPAVQPVLKRNFNLATYSNTNYNNSNTGLLKTTRNSTTRPVYDNNNYSSGNKGLSDKVRTIFSNTNEGSGSSRTYNPGNSSSGNSSGGSNRSSGGSSGGGGGVSRPTRNN